MSIPHVVRTKQATRKTTNPHQCPTCSELGGVGIHASVQVFFYKKHVYKKHEAEVREKLRKI